MTWQNAYSVEGTDFAVVDVSHPNAIGHRGADWVLAAGSVVPAFTRCTVIASNLYSKILGNCLTAQLPNGLYVSWAHLKAGTRPENGTVLNPGDQVGLVAGWNDDHGTAWTGPHIHMTLSGRIDGIFLGETRNPRPTVYAALKGIGVADIGNLTPITTNEGLEITMTWEQFRDFMSRWLTYHSRQDGALGKESTLPEQMDRIENATNASNASAKAIADATKWETFRDNSWRFLNYHSRHDGPNGKAPTIFEQLDNIEAAVKNSGKVTLVIDDAAAALIATQVAAQIKLPVPPSAGQIADELAKRLVN